MMRATPTAGRDLLAGTGWHPWPVLRLLLILVCATIGLRGISSLIIHQVIPVSTLIIDRNGKTLRMTTASDGQYRLWTELSGFSNQTIEAVLVKEDNSFWWNMGVDYPALLTAAVHSIILRDYRAGASTLTMQAVRLAFHLDTDNIPGKIGQIIAALTLSLVANKQDILELYLNLAPCGGNVQGLGTASRIWFGKDPMRLNLAESMALAVLPQDPSHRNPADSKSWPAINRARNRLILQYQTKHPELANELKRQLDMPLAFRHELPFLAPHLTSSLLREHPNDKRLNTSIDLSMQSMVETTIRHYTTRYADLGVNNACAMIVKADTMEVLATVGSADFSNSLIQGQVDGTRAYRSPGSTLKPFIYALAIEQGLIHPLTVLKDARVHFGGYNPDNFDNEFEGPIRATDALIKSRNVPAVSLALRIRDPDLYEMLQKAGMSLPFSRQHYGLSIVLGGAEVSMKNLMSLYGSLAAGGTQYGTVRPVRYLLDQPRGTPVRIFSKESAWLVRQMLATKPRPDANSSWNASPFANESVGEAAASATGPQSVAYKTGTSIGFRDAWSVGMCDGLIVAVWVGDFAGASNPEFIGLKNAAPLMFEIIDAWRARRLNVSYLPQEPDLPPAGIVRVPVCSVSGDIATALCPRTLDAPFIAGVSPISVCTVHQEFHIDQLTGFRRAHEIPGVTKNVLFEIWPSDIMELFTQAGLSRAVPPTLATEDTNALQTGSGSGLAPQILSPVNRLRYVNSTIDERIPLVASIASDAHTIWWFIDDTVLGSLKRGETWFWKPRPGHHIVRAVDDLGRSARAEFDVE